MGEWLTLNNFIAMFTIPLIRLPMWLIWNICEKIIYYFDKWDEYIPALRKKYDE
tara:strand:+ start:364 stop:525 length:162 start_codon:yes stop_codon:yes gene_type:complete